jgi:hypothetical protein
MSPYEQPPPRPREQRKADVLAMLAAETDIDLWVASADASGRAHLIPLSYGWDSATVSVATPTTSRTAVNLIRAGWARLALRVTPHNIQAWRESAEIEHRQLMRRGEWLV